MRNKTNLLIAILLLVSAFISACSPTLSAQPVLAQEEKPIQRTINVTGKGKVTLTPDIAHISIGVHTENENAAEAVASNNQQSEKVTNALEAFQIDPKDVRTTNFSIFPQQQFDNEGNLTGTMYVVDNTVFVTIRDIDTLGEVLDEVVKAGANSVSGVQFDVNDKETPLSEARTSAVEDAQRQAEELAEAAGVTLGQVLTINSYGGAVPFPVYDYKFGVGGGAALEAASVPVSPGQMELTQEGNVVYEIR